MAAKDLPNKGVENQANIYIYVYMDIYIYYIYIYIYMGAPKPSGIFLHVPFVEVWGSSIVQSKLASEMLCLSILFL